MRALGSGSGRLLFVDAIEDPVDEAARFVGAELLRHLEGLVDRHLRGDAGSPQQLEDALAEDVAVDDRHPLELPVLRVATDQLVDLGLVHLGAAHERLRELARLRVHRVPAPELVEMRLGILLALHVELVEQLQRELAGLASASHQRFPRALRPRPALGSRGAPRRARSHAAISSAASAASSPRLPTAPPARSHACSSVSAVITPKVTGTPVSSPARAMPWAEIGRASCRERV